MAKSIFEQISDGLEQHSNLGKLEARGTVRLALMQAGLDAASLSASRMRGILSRVLPSELRARGVEQAESVCEALQTALKASHPADAGANAEDRESPDAVFRRLARP